MKAFWRTSEFWLVVATVAAQAFGVPVHELTPIATGAYALGRSILKAFRR